MKNNVIGGKLNLKMKNDNKIIIMNKSLYHKRHLNNKNLKVIKKDNNIELIEENNKLTKTEISFLKSKKKLLSEKIKIIGKKSYNEKINEYSKDLEKYPDINDLPKISPG
jgi:thymidylate synthase